mgnify:FL=1
MKALKFLSFSMAIFMIGCTSFLLPEPAPANLVYRLGVTQQSIPKSQKAVIIRVDRPKASSFLQGKDLIVSLSDLRLASVEQAQWEESIPDMVQNTFVNLLGNREGLIGVLPSSGVRSDIRISITIKRFEAYFDNGKSNAPLIIVHLNSTVSNASDRAFIGTHDTRVVERSKGIEVSSIVESINNSNTKAIKDIINWLDNPEIFNKLTSGG